MPRNSRRSATARGSIGRCRTGGPRAQFADPPPDVGVYAPFGTAFSAGRHPVSAASALETLRIIRGRNLVAHLQRRLREFARKPLVGEARRGGRSASSARSISGRHGEPVVGAPAPGSVVGIAASRLREHGVIARSMQDARAFCPPHTIAAAEVDLLMDQVGDVLDGMTRDGVAVGR